MTISAHPLYNVLCALTNSDTPSLNVLTSPFSSNGTSYVARDLALLAAQHYQPQGHRVALIDYDLNKQSQTMYFETLGSKNIHGSLLGPYDATFGQKPFWQISPDIISGVERTADSTVCNLFLVGDTGLAITHFNWDSVKSGQTVHITKSTEYWQALRQNFACIIVDCPAFDRSDVALNVIPDADNVIFVSSEDNKNHSAHKDLAETLKQSGKACKGLIVNTGAQAPTTARHPA